jgi:hypothetical protein
MGGRNGPELQPARKTLHRTRLFLCWLFGLWRQTIPRTPHTVFETMLGIKRLLVVLVLNRN